MELLEGIQHKVNKVQINQIEIQYEVDQVVEVLVIWFLLSQLHGLTLLPEEGGLEVVREHRDQFNELLHHGVLDVDVSLGFYDL